MNKKLLITKQPQASRAIRQLRQEIGLTQEKFASLLGVTCLTVNRWENEKTQPSPLAIKQIEEIFFGKINNAKNNLTSIS